MSGPERNQPALCGLEAWVKRQIKTALAGELDGLPQERLDLEIGRVLQAPAAQRELAQALAESWLPDASRPRLEAALARLDESCGEAALEQALRQALLPGDRLPPERIDEMVAACLRRLRLALLPLERRGAQAVGQAALQSEAQRERLQTNLDRRFARLEQDLSQPTGPLPPVIATVNGPVYGLVSGPNAQVTQYFYPPPLLVPEPDPAYSPPALPAGLPEPGALPPGSRLPFARNALFTGRAGDLQALAQTIFVDRPEAAQAGCGPLTVVSGLSGYGGIGKTQLAVELAYRYGRFTHAVHWLYAAQALQFTDLYSEIAACGERMNLPDWPGRLPEQVAATLEAWNAHPNRLVILDNLDEPALLPELLCALNGVRLLITTRRTDFSPELGLAVHRLDTFLRPESQAYLRQAIQDRAAPPAEADLDALAARLDDLPLALHLAAAYLSLRPTLDIPAYLQAVQRSGALYLPEPPPSQARPTPTAHERSLYATFKLSWDALERRDRVDRDARGLFRAAGYCAPNAVIPNAVLAGVLDGLAEGMDGGRLAAVRARVRRAAARIFPPRARLENPPPTGAERLDFALARLHALGLAERSPAGLTLHPLLAELAVYMDRQAQPGLVSTLADAAGGLVQEALDTGLPDEFRSLLPHAHRIAEALHESDPEQAAIWYNNLGFSMWKSGGYAAACAYIQKALDIDRATHGEHHPDTAHSLNDLGTLLSEMGDLPAARTHLEQALEIRRSVLGEMHPEIAQSLNNLGALYRDLGDLSAARAYFEQALAIHRAVLGEKHINTAASLNNLAMLLQTMGDLPAARPYLEQALAIQRAVLGEQHPTVAIGLNNLGMLLKSMGDLPTARARLEQALAIQLAALGEQHPDTALSLNNLGIVLQDTGDYAAARSYYERALRIQRAVFGEQHPRTATCLCNLGAVIRMLGDRDAAQAYFEQALAIQRTVLGEQHPDMALVLNNLAMLHKDKNDLPAARQYFERALAIGRAALGEQHPVVAQILNNLGASLKDLGDLPAARLYLEQALAVQRSLLGEQHPDTALSLNNLGTVYIALGEVSAARACLESARSIFEATLPPDHPYIRLVQRNLTGLPPA